MTAFARIDRLCAPKLEDWEKLINNGHVNAPFRASLIKFSRRLQYLVSMIVVLILLGGCASTNLMNAWHEDRYEGPGVSRFLVIGLSSNPNRRRYFESTFSSRLRDAGLEAEPSYRLLPEDEITEEREVIESVLAKTSAEAILTTRLVDVAREQSYVPPGFELAPPGFYDYYYPTRHMLFRPGYVITNTSVLLETNIYDAATKALLWTGTTRSFNPASADRMVEELANIVIRELGAHGFIRVR